MSAVLTAYHTETVQLTSPVGGLSVTITARGVSCIDFLGAEHPVFLNSPGSELARQVLHALDQYFCGARNVFEGIPLDLSGGTPFQQAVWQALLTIPYGETRSYAWLAQAIGKPQAVRAVGQANRRNPLPIIVPCHRVLPQSGGLGGYMGPAATGVQIKQALLTLEGARLL
jgi:methylated-DNA-[protein]-cysteine S-methyltransferase